MGPGLLTFVTASVGAALQLLVFAAVPAVVYLARRRTLRGWGAWVGLVAAPRRVVLLGVALAVALAALKVPLLWELLLEPETPSGQLLAHRRVHGWSAGLVGAWAVNAVLKTGLSEELLFRGFVGKRLVARLGFARGNALQAALFGALHLPLLLVAPAGTLGPAAVAAVVLGPTVGGWLFGWLDFRLAGGSILPSWAMHATGNLVAYGAPLLLA